MSNTTNNTQEIDNVLSVTKGEWKFASTMQSEVTQFYTSLDEDTMFAITHNEVNFSEKRGNNEAICNAVNNTYGKSINPESVPLMLEALKEAVSYMNALLSWQTEKVKGDRIRDAILKAKEAINKATL